MMTGFTTGPDGQPVLLIFTPSGKPFTFTFTFDVPFNPGRVLDTPQTVTASDLDMTLQKLVVTPSMTRAVLCFTAPADNGMWLPEAGIIINGNEALHTTMLGMGQPTADPACTAYLIPQAPLLDKPAADWTLMVTRLRLAGSEDQAQVNAELQNKGIQLVPQPDGGFGYAPPEGMPYDEFSRLIEEITAQFQKKVEGPWTFHFTLP
jgi:hypothetical protein